jgi:uncharacterized protein YuzE
MIMRIEGHYDADADIAWVRFEGHDASTTVGEESDSGLRELDPVMGEIVGLEFWQASRRLPAEFLRMLPPPQVEVAAA